ncbi:MAG: Obg family GTPase CgtA [Actinomycetota bacterium]|nr:Obg family GTPase CgtA [Actinomycetota bacterium]
MLITLLPPWYLIWGWFLLADNSFVIADIPGLIEGAHEGTGLGDKFLKHVMRTSVIVYVLDAAKLVYDQSGLGEDFLTLRKELSLYSAKLAEKEYVVAVNKVDLISSPQILEEIKEDIARHTENPILLVSAVTGQGLDQLVRTMNDLTDRHRAKPEESEGEEQQYKVYDIYTTRAASDRIKVEKLGEEYVVKNKELERMVQMTDLGNAEALAYLRQRLQKMHIGDRVKELGVETGATVIIGKLVFELKD